MAWYNPSWSYRKKYTVTNSSGGTLTDYQVLLTIDTATLITAGKMQADCDDIRITAADGTTLQNFWVDPNTINTSATKVWFKVSSLATGDTDFYIYYGNSSAASASSIANTFIYGDDFSTNTSANYTTLGGAVSVDTTNKWMKFVGVSGDNTVASPTTQTNPASYIVEAYVKIISAIAAGDYVAGVLGFKSTLTGGDGYVAQFGSISGAQKVDVEKFTAAHLVTTAITFSNNTFYPIKGTFINSNITALFNNATSANSTDATYTSGKYGMRGFNTDAYFQYFRVRVYTATEPTGSLGTEETGIAYTQTLTETATFTPNAYKATIRNLSENPTFTVTLVKETIRTLSETATFTETFIRDIVKTLTENITFTDTLVRAISRTFTESATFTVSLVKGINKTLTETATFTISFIKRLGRTATNWIKQIATAGGFTKQTPTPSTWTKEEPTDGDWT